MDTNTVTPVPGEDAHEEEIHLPPPSWSPIILALGMTLLVFGVSLASIVFVPLRTAHFTVSTAPLRSSETRSRLMPGMFVSALPIGAVLTLIGLGTWIYDEIKNASAHAHDH